MKIRLQFGDVVVELFGGPSHTLADVAAQAGRPLSMLCGGRGRCGRCRVVLRSGRFLVDGRPVEASVDHPIPSLACRTGPAGPLCEVDIPPTSLNDAAGRITEDFVLDSFPWDPPMRFVSVTAPAEFPAPPSSDLELAAKVLPFGPAAWSARPAAMRELAGALGASDAAVVAAWAADGHRELVGARPPGDCGWLGLAADLGTTTMVVLLADLADGRILSRASDYNAQMRCGADVASRITWAEERPGGLEELQRLAVRVTINPLIETACRAAGREPSDVVHVIAAGNSVMEHLFLGLPPSGIGRIPFRPVARRYPMVSAGELGLMARATALVEVVPSLTGRVGGDLTADAAAAGLLDRPGRHALLDIGTNGEMLLWDGRRLRCTAAAAGPAFEGAGLMCGMRAALGAIERIAWTGEGFRCEVIGGGPARGLCGSAVIDFLAQGRRAGLLDEYGRFNRRRVEELGLATEEIQRGRPVLACRLAPPASEGAPAVVITEADVAEALKAKAAFQSGMATLLDAAGLRPVDLDGVVLAGGFARHIHLGNAIAIGLLPGVPLERIEVIGNSSLAGAYLALGSVGVRRVWERLLEAAEPVELNLCSGFESAFVDGLMLPEC